MILEKIANRNGAPSLVDIGRKFVGEHICFGLGESFWLSKEDGTTVLRTSRVESIRVMD